MDSNFKPQLDEMGKELQSTILARAVQESFEGMMEKSNNDKEKLQHYSI